MWEDRIFIYAPRIAKPRLMSFITPSQPLPSIAPREIQHLRESLGWSQVKLARFLEKNSATVSRWEAGHFAPDAITNSVLMRLWIDVFGSYEGPYLFEEESAPLATKNESLLASIGKALLVGGVTYFIVKGLSAEEDQDG